MKNLYKIEDELYIISNTENINENCWIITDGRLVQVSYLLSDEVAKGNKVILTTNKLLIKDGVQAIDDEFLEWFVKNSSCEKVETIKVPYFDESGYSHLLIIPKEEPKFVTVNIESAKGEDLGKVTYIPLPNIDYIPKQETLIDSLKDILKHITQMTERVEKGILEEAALEYSKMEYGEDKKVEVAFINGAKWREEQLILSDEEIDKLAKEHILYNDSKRQWFIEGMKMYRDKIKINK